MDGLAVPTGRNRWILARTDRDGATPSQVEATAIAFLVKVLGPLSPQGSGNLETVPTLDGNYYIGAARPLRLRVSRDVGAFAASSGKTLGHWKQQTETYQVNAETPWYVEATFDWRAPDARTDRWPRRTVNALGWAVDRPKQLDWLLLAAYAEPETGEPDQTWFDETKKTVQRDLGNLLGSAMNIGLIAGLGFLLFTASKERR